MTEPSEDEVTFSPEMIAETPVHGLFSEGHEMASHPALADFKNVEGLARSFIDTQRMMGMDRNQLLAIPPEGADDETVKAFHRALGVPEKPDMYDLDPETKPVEGLTQDDAFLTAMKVGAHAIGITPAQFRGLHKMYQEYANQTYEQFTQTVKTGRDEAETALKAEWGDAYDQNVKNAGLAIAEWGGQEAIDYLNETGLGDHPAIVKMMANAGAILAEDSGSGDPRDGTSRKGGNALTPAQAQDEISKKYSDEAFMKAHSDAEHPNHKNAVAEMERLFKQAYPE